MKKSLVWLLAALVSVPAVAANDDGQNAAQEEKKICKSEKVTGSLTKVRRICMTERDWRNLQERTKKGMDEMQMRPDNGVRPGPLG